MSTTKRIPIAGQNPKSQAFAGWEAKPEPIRRDASQSEADAGKRHTGATKLMTRTIRVGESLRLTFGENKVLITPQTWIDTGDSKIVLFKLQLSGAKIKGEGMFQLKVGKKEIIPIKTSMEDGEINVLGVPFGLMEVNTEEPVKIKVGVHLENRRLSEEKFTVILKE